jgi:hypothetical protein
LSEFLSVYFEAVMTRMRLLFGAALAGLLLAGAAFAQPEPVSPQIPFGRPTPAATVVPLLDDARLSTCAAPMLPNFLPYTVRPGDTLAGLLAGTDSLTPAALAALNCLDDPAALPAGAVIWLPAEAAAVIAGDPLPLSADDQAAAIHQFEASSAVAANNQPVTLSWEAEGISAHVYPCPRRGSCDRPFGAPEQPVTGTLTVDGFQQAGSFIFRLEVIDSAGAAVTRDLTLTITCAHAWLDGTGAAPRCPDGPALTVFAVWQPFEGGNLIWFSDSGHIYMLTHADGRVRIYEDRYVEGQPDPGDIPPEGRFTPIRGFGQLWQALGGASSVLGWALAPETGFDSARQPAGRVAYTTYIAGPEGVVYAITDVPGLEAGFWRQTAPHTARQD